MKKTILSFALPLLLALSPAAAQAARLLWVGVDGNAAIEGMTETVSEYQSGAVNAFRVSVSDGNATDCLVFAHEDAQGQMVVGDTAPVVRALDFANGGAAWVPLSLADGYTDTNLVVTMELGYVDWANNASLDSFEELAYATNSLGSLLDAPHVSIQGDLNAPALTPWTPDEFTPLAWAISYTLNGGTNDADNPDIYTSADLPVTLRDATREGYTFAGWTNESGVVVTTIAAGTTGDLSFGATWLENVEPPTGTDYSYDGTSKTGVPTGTGYTLTGDATATAAGSYTVTASLAAGYAWSDGTVADKTVTWSIAQITASVTIVGANATTVFDGTSHGVSGYTATADTPLYNVNSDIAFSGTATASRTVVGTEHMGLTAAQFSNTNPNFSTVTFTVTDGFQTITPKTATITVSDSSKTYGSADPAFTGTVDGLVNANDLGTITYTRTGSDENVGTYTDVLTASYTPNANYTVTVVPGDFEITAKTVTITVADASKVYGAADPAFTGTVEGLENEGDLGTITYSRTGNDEDVGTYNDVLTATYTANANYNVTVVAGDFEITAKAVTITVNDSSKVYGAADPVFTGTVEGLENEGDLGDISYSRTGGDENVGTYSDVLTASYTANANYSVTVIPGDYEITAKAVTITVNDSSKVYGAADPAFTGTVEGLEDEGDLGTITYSRTGDAEDVGTYADVLTASYTANANYSVTVVPGDFEITAKAVTITVNDSSKTYGATDPAFTGTVEGLENEGDLGTISYSRTGDDENVGTYAGVLTATYTANANYSVTVVPGNFEITAKAVTITVNDSSKVYGAADPAFTGTVEDLENEGDLGTITYSRTGNDEDVGTYTGVLTASYTANANYNVTVVPGNFEITAKAVTITVADASKVYGAADPAFTGTVEGLENEGDLGTITYSRTRNDENVGTYADVLTASYTANANYNVTVLAGDFEITAKAVTITVADASKVYGTSDPAFTGTVEGLENEGDLGTISYSRTGDDEDVGTYAGVLTATYTANANYSVTVVPGDFEITVKAVTITVADASKVYGAADPAFTGTVEGLENEGDLGTITYSRTGNDEDVGTYTGVLTASYTANANYNVTVVPGNFEITAKAVTITVADASKVYGAADPAFTGTVEGLENEGDLGTITYSRTGDDEDVGTYAGVLTASYTANANYSVTVVSGDFEITAKGVTITVNDSSKVYGASDSAFTGTVEGLENEGDLGTITYSRTGSDEDVGTYAGVLTASYTANANYSVTVVPGNFEIMAKAVTITVNDSSKVYGASDPAFTGTVEGLENEGDLGTITYSRTGDAEDVGTYAGVLTASYTANANYSVTVVPGDFEITAKAVTITVNDASKVYGAADPVFTGTVDGLENEGDLGTITYSRTGDDEDVGTYTGVLTASYTANANYSVTVLAGDFEITAKAVTITVADASKVYGTSDPAFTGTVEGLENEGDLGTISYSRTGDDEDVGTYAGVLTATYTANANYSVTVVPGDFAITAKAVTITVESASKTYGAVDPAFTGTVEGLENEGDLGTITYSRTGDAEDVGTYAGVLTATYTANANYSVTVVAGDFEITAKAVTITVSDASKVYGATDPTFTGTVEGLENAGDLGTITYSRTGDAEDVGTYAGVLTASYTANANYSVTVVPGDFEITAKAVTITVNDSSKVYGSADPAFTGTVGGLENEGDLGTITYSRTGSAEDVGTYTGVLTASYTANANYNVTVVPGDFEITAKAVTITVADSSKVYGVADPAFTGTVEGLENEGDLGTITYSRTGSAEDVGTYTGVLTATYTVNANYNVTVVPGNFEITAKAVTITVNDSSKVYGDADPAFTGTVEGLENEGDLGTITYSRTGDAEDVGTYAGVLTATYTANANYSVTVVPGDFEITAKAVTITVNDASKVYGAADPAFTGTVEGLENEGDLGTITYSRTGDDEDVGTYTGVLTATYTANANYSVTVVPGNFEITAKTVTITVADASKVYGVADPAFTGTVEGLENEGDLGTITYSRTGNDENVGTYADVLTASYTANANYSVTVVPGDFEITAKAVTITVADASKVYGAADPAFTGTVEGLENEGDLGTIAYSRTGNDENVGTYDDVLTATYTANANYNVTVLAGDFEITAKAVTITVADASKVYGTSDPAFTGTVEGLENEGDLGTISYSRTGDDEDVGTYAGVLTASCTANANYSVTVVPGDFEITAKAVTITVSDASKVYGAADPVFTGTVEGLENEGDLGTISYSRTGDEENVGTYAGVLTASYTANANYSVTVVPGDFEITAKAVTITVANASKVYGVTDPAFTGTVEGLENEGDLGTITYSRTGNDEDVGTYAGVLTASYTANANYSVTVVPGDFEITAKTVTITVNDSSKVYGAADPAFTGTVEGLENEGDLGTITYSRTGSDEDVGTYAGVLTASYTTNANYSVTVVPGDFEITAKAVTITVNDSSKTYGASDPAFTGTVDGLVNANDLGTITYTRTGSDENVGTYTDVLTASYTPNANYTVTVVPGDFEITAKTVTITVADASKVYGAADPAFTGTVEGLENEGDLGTITYSRTGNDEDVGTYNDVLMATYTANANYNVTVVPGDFEITAKAVTITVADASKVYGAADPAFTGTVEGLENEGDLGTITYSRTGSDEDVGTYADVLTASYTANANYSVTVVPGDFEITAKTVTITVNDSSKVYGAADPAFTGTVEGLENEGDLGTITYSRTGSDEDVGTYAGVLTASYTTNANYSVTVVPGDFEITAKAVTITVNDASKVYGAANPTFTGTVEGLENEGDLGTITYSRTGNDENVGTYNDVLTATYTANANYNVTVVAGDFEITAKAVTITVADASKVYGASDPAFTGTVEGLENEGDLGTITYSRTGDAEDVGTYADVLTASYTANANYSVTVVPGDFEVTAKAVTITVNDASKTYGAVDPTFTGTVEGLENEGDLGTITYSRTGSDENVGTYAGVLTASYTANANYSVTVVPGDFEITAKAVTITVNDSCKTYGAADPAFMGTVEGLENEGDLGTITYSRTGSDEDIGTYTDVLTASYTANANYSVTVVPGDFEITAKALTIAVVGTASSAIYTGTEQTGTVAYTLSCEDALYDESKVAYRGAATVAGTEVGRYAYGLDSSDFSYNDANIEATFAVTDAAFSITKASITVTVTGTASSADYNGQEQTEAVAYTLSCEDAFYNATNVVYSGATTVAGTAVGSYAYGLDASAFSYDDADITATFDVTDAAFTIEPRAVTITVEDDGKDYGENDPKFAGTVEGLVADGDLGTIEYIRTNVEEVVGIYSNVLTATYTSNANYSVTVVPGDFIIGPKFVAVIVRATRDTRVFIGEEQTFTPEISYEVEEEGTPLFDVSLVEFHGPETIARTDVGTTRQNLADNQFSYPDGNFDVVFEIARDGALKIIDPGEVDILADLAPSNDHVLLTVVNVPDEVPVQIIFTDNLEDSSSWEPLKNMDFSLDRAFTDNLPPIGVVRAYRARFRTSQ